MINPNDLDNLDLVPSGLSIDHHGRIYLSLADGAGLVYVLSPHDMRDLARKLIACADRLEVSPDQFSMVAMPTRGNA